MNREEIREILFDALINNFGDDIMPNPAYDRKAERAAWKNDEDYNEFEFIRATREMQKKGNCVQVFKAADGYNSMAILTFEDVVNAIMLEFDARKDQVIEALNNSTTSSGPPKPPSYLAEEVARQKRTVGTPKKITYTDPSKPAWKIYAEGYVATGESGGATYLGTGYGDTFDEACAWFKKYGEISDPKLMSKGNGGKKWYFWGCELFDNLHDAQRRYG